VKQKENNQLKTKNMRYTTEQLKELLQKEIQLHPNTYTDKRKTIEEMLRMRGIKL